jgi:GrpB-like predicted nucleotidyltransferase (UPF0157 family)
MLSPEQEIWINHLSDSDRINIFPFDNTAEEKFQVVKEIIREALGKSIPVVHRGASSLGISGQDEIDVYIPVPPDAFNSLIDPLTELFGKPGSHYPMERTKFVTFVEDKEITVFLINEESGSWIDGVRFETYLHTHPDALDQYRLLKEDGEGLSVREYYRRKTEFINEILAIAEE